MDKIFVGVIEDILHYIEEPTFLFTCKRMYFLRQLWIKANHPEYLVAFPEWWRYKRSIPQTRETAIIAASMGKPGSIAFVKEFFDKDGLLAKKVIDSRNRERCKEFFDSFGVTNLDNAQIIKLLCILDDVEGMRGVLKNEYIAPNALTTIYATNPPNIMREIMANIFYPIEKLYTKSGFRRVERRVRQAGVFWGWELLLAIPFRNDKAIEAFVENTSHCISYSLIDEDYAFGLRLFLEKVGAGDIHSLVELTMVKGARDCFDLLVDEYEAEFHSEMPEKTPPSMWNHVCRKLRIPHKPLSSKYRIRSVDDL